jgi:bifunctional non-homologous end joining protein LigD
MSLEKYRQKRNFAKTPEPSGRSKNKKQSKRRLRFVVQKHDATRLHYDFRLETNSGVLKSWAVPKGISLDPAVKRIAIPTEDHPLDYIDFEGVIPEGNYGAGHVIVWDTGVYDSAQDIEQQIEKGKISIVLNGKKINGAFALVRMKDGGSKSHWLLLKEKDEFASKEDLAKDRPESVLTGETIGAPPPRGESKEFPAQVRPMLAMPVDKPFDDKDWVFEVKWDGVRSILFWDRTRSLLEIRSRKGSDITYRYPEIASRVESAVKCKESVVLDGEIVVLSEEGAPAFQRHQRRMNVYHARDIELLSRESPATYYVFDILYLDGRSLEGLQFIERRRILSKVVKDSKRIRISDYIEEKGKSLFQNAIKMKLEGIVAKHKYARYMQGTRSPSWLKIKGILTQDCVLIGYTRGEGNREGYFGSLILAARYHGKLKFIGHSGSGFGFDQLEEAFEVMQKLKMDRCPIDHVPYVNREPVWLRPELVAEVKFNGWTQEMIMRAPIFLRFREDKSPAECIIEAPKEKSEIIAKPASESKAGFSNTGKVFWPAFADRRELTKGDLIDYYDKISDFILPHLRDRPLSLSRYPDGILGKSFYHKNWSASKPDETKTIAVFSEARNGVINHVISNNRETLLWLANLGCIEMHPWYSRVHDFSACVKAASAGEAALDEDKCGLNTPDFIVFDLDPYVYSGREKRGQEPEYNVKGFKAAVSVALDLKDLFDELGIASYVKTSGKTGLHVFVPVAPLYTYDQTRAFAQIIGKMLDRRVPGKITMEWSVSKRRGRVFFDYNQNAMGKTIASIFSARPTATATVSMPISWNELLDVLPTDFTMPNVPSILYSSGDPWRQILEKKQDIGKILQRASEA